MSLPIVAFISSPEVWQDYRMLLPAALARHGLSAQLQFGAEHPERVDYIVYAPFGQPVDFTPFTAARAVLSLWAGVESIVGNASLTQPLCRMVDPSLSEGMVAYVTGHVLRHHLGMDQHLYGQDGIWRSTEVPPLPRHRRLGILGLGELGQACAQALSGLGFAVSGWSRRPQQLAGIRCHSGPEGLHALLNEVSILITLLPLTAQTQHLLDATTLAQLPRGAVVINPGRGGLIDDAALLAALDQGQIGHATLDVFQTEPLPSSHPFWAHPQVTVTPHIAATTRAETAVELVAENIRRSQAGEPLLHLVDRQSGY